MYSENISSYWAEARVRNPRFTYVEARGIQVSESRKIEKSFAYPTIFLHWMQYLYLVRNRGRRLSILTISHRATVSANLEQAEQAEQAEQ